MISASARELNWSACLLNFRCTIFLRVRPIWTSLTSSLGAELESAVVVDATKVPNVAGAEDNGVELVIVVIVIGAETTPRAKCAGPRRC